MLMEGSSELFHSPLCCNSTICVLVLSCPECRHLLLQNLDHLQESSHHKYLECGPYLEEERVENPLLRPDYFESLLNRLYPIFR